MASYVVEVTDSALMHLCISGIESYCLAKGPKETYGLIWGSVIRSQPAVTHFRIDHVFIDIAAKRKKNSVTYSEEGLNLKRRVLSRCWPTQAFLGDFHTHPYLNLKEVTNDTELYRASDTDRQDVEEVNKAFWLKVGLKVNLILTICKLKRLGSAQPKRLEDHIIEWTLGGTYRLWLAGYVARKRSDKRSGLFLSPREKSWPSAVREHRVRLDIPSVIGSSNFGHQ